MKRLAVLLALMLFVSLAGCGSSDPAQGSGASVPQEPETPAETPQEPETPAEERTATLYIGTRARGFREYTMTYQGELIPETLLDSIQKTLQEGFTGEGGDPDALDVWYYLEGEEPLALPGLGLAWPLDQPYQWDAAETAPIE